MATILTEEMVGRDFAARARAFSAATGKPLFEYELDEYRVELHALPQFFSEGPYELSDVNAEYPGCLTWRRLADGLDGYTFEELIAEAQDDFEITITPGEYDDDVPVHIVENFLQYFNYFERPEVNAFNELEGWFGHPLFERGASIHPDRAVGRFELVDGPAPGCSYRAVLVADVVSLAALQRLLDRLRSGIRLVVGEPCQPEDVWDSFPNMSWCPTVDRRRGKFMRNGSIRREQVERAIGIAGFGASATRVDERGRGHGIIGCPSSLTTEHAILDGTCRIIEALGKPTRVVLRGERVKRLFVLCLAQITGDVRAHAELAALCGEIQAQKLEREGDEAGGWGGWYADRGHGEAAR